MFCKNCGRKLDDNVKFCTQCGQKVTPLLKTESEMGNLVLRAQNGDKRAFEELIAKSERFVNYNCMKMLQNQEDALDVTQEIFINVYKKLSSLTNPDSYWGWLKTMTVNYCKNQLCKTNKYILVEEDSPEEVAYENAENEDVQLIPEQALDSTETANMVLNAVNQLPDAQKMCIIMYYYDDMKVSDISTTIGVSEGTIRSRLFLARKQLKVTFESMALSGVKLYGVAPVGYLAYIAYFLKKEAEYAPGLNIQILTKAALTGVKVTASTAVSVSATAVEAAGVAGVAASVGTEAAAVAGTALTAGTAAAAGSVVSAGVGIGLLHGIAAKVVIGILAASTVVGGGVITASVIRKNNQQTENNRTEEVEDTLASEESSMLSSSIDYVQEESLNTTIQEQIEAFDSSESLEIKDESSPLEKETESTINIEGSNETSEVEEPKQEEMELISSDMPVRADKEYTQNGSFQEKIDFFGEVLNPETGMRELEFLYEVINHEESNIEITNIKVELLTNDGNNIAAGITEWPVTCIPMIVKEGETAYILNTEPIILPDEVPDVAELNIRVTYDYEITRQEGIETMFSPSADNYIYYDESGIRLTSDFSVMSDSGDLAVDGYIGAIYLNKAHEPIFAVTSFLPGMALMGNSPSSVTFNSRIPLNNIKPDDIYTILFVVRPAAYTGDFLIPNDFFTFDGDSKENWVEVFMRLDEYTDLSVTSDGLLLSLTDTQKRAIKHYFDEEAEAAINRFEETGDEYNWFGATTNLDYNRYAVTVYFNKNASKDEVNACIPPLLRQCIIYKLLDAGQYSLDIPIIGCHSSTGKQFCESVGGYDYQLSWDEDTIDKAGQSDKYE